MQLAKTLLLIALVAMFTAAAILFVALNRDPVELEFLITQSAPIPIGAIVIIGTMLGVFLGLLVSLGLWLRFRMTLRSMRKELKVVRKELDSFRNLPLSSSGLNESSNLAAGGRG